MFKWQGSACLAGIYLGLLGLAAWATCGRERGFPLARFVTSLRGRTPNQQHNVALAARSIDGRWLYPGEVFSFNAAVGPWSSDSGFRIAPVSYDGELVPSWGGGVCQASSALYNAALLGGLTVVERHRHRWLPRYVAPGRDAAVGYSAIDLKLRNDHPWPVRLDATVRGELIEFAVVAAARAADCPQKYAIVQRVTSVTQPVVVRRPWREGMPARPVRNSGRPGGRVLTYRARLVRGLEVARELVSDDSYPAMNRLLLVD